MESLHGFSTARWEHGPAWSAGLPACRIAGFQPAHASSFCTALELANSLPIENRRYGRLENLRYGPVHEKRMASLMQPWVRQTFLLSLRPFLPDNSS